ncbi:hypothetical protein FV232_12815 [Methylobacterium sp. WL30]|jgi:hypothetical protein|uniref:hypothetical protein n=1 Tax=unclassified Methylobacterium TaxID=2615210 RepID=UPI0011C96CFF|nr:MULTISPECIES: hypothetical protein [unclassified Methylobacterium]RZK97001.1 MAG: hypothetical protein EOO66_04590 [Methylobacterium sp.]MCJ2078415.1 hypothetical protein [Methylobacterium sp. E-016]TXN36679.1 hypothetical protein FV225_13980 [Methylobacterium sp. WL93]TXN49283.1 hypothetical protein FV227_17290 [Methylobacterium sp. WL119]TXN67242.1 hypothetical protein FV232_12815 [Methylobacterium sp. WL30]
MRLAILLATSLSALAVSRPVQAQAPGRPAKPAPAVQGPVSAPVIACPSLANYRLLRREAPDEAAALARLGDARADHLGCTAFPRDRIAALAEHVALGGAQYDCLALQGTAICQWTATGTVDLPVPAKSQPKPSAADRGRR